MAVSELSPLLTSLFHRLVDNCDLFRCQSLHNCLIAILFNILCPYLIHPVIRSFQPWPAFKEIDEDDDNEQVKACEKKSAQNQALVVKIVI